MRRDGLVVFGYSNLLVFNNDLYGELLKDESYCYLKNGGIDRFDECRDGGPGSDKGHDQCFFGTHGKCLGRVFSFLSANAGPEESSEDCDGRTNEKGVPYKNNGVCEDGLMWSYYPPGPKAKCAPGTDVDNEVSNTLPMTKRCTLIRLALHRRQTAAGAHPRGRHE